MVSNIRGLSIVEQLWQIFEQEVALLLEAIFFFFFGGGGGGGGVPPPRPQITQQSRTASRLTVRLNSISVILISQSLNITILATLRESFQLCRFSQELQLCRAALFPTYNCLNTYEPISRATTQVSLRVLFTNMSVGRMKCAILATQNK